MHVEPVDERDSRWESAEPHFRVYFFDGGSATQPWNVATYDVTDADIIEVIHWAQAETENDARLFAIALVAEHGPPEDRRRGLIWLHGGDINDHPHDRHLNRAFKRMEEMSRNTGRGSPSI